MNKDVTQQTSTTDSEKLSLILTIVQSFTVRFDNVDSRLNTIDSRLVHVERAVNEMQPVLQKAVTDIGQLQEGQRELQQAVSHLQEGQQRLEAGQEVLRSGLEALHHSVRYRFLILSGSVKAELRNLDRRVTWLELNSNPPKPQT